MFSKWRLSASTSYVVTTGYCVEAHGLKPCYGLIKRHPV